MNTANYVIENHGYGRDVVVIRDIGPWTEHASVTNDAERVVADMLANGLLRVGKRLYYYDSDGVLDEIKFDPDGFTGFAPGPRRA